MKVITYDIVLEFDSNENLINLELTPGSVIKPVRKRKVLNFLKSFPKKCKKHPPLEEFTSDSKTESSQVQEQLIEVTKHQENDSGPVNQSVIKDQNGKAEESDVCAGKDLEMVTKAMVDLSDFVALDCEMVRTTTQVMALARCSIVSSDGDILYDKFVRPPDPIVDYVSRFSGVYPKHMKAAVPHSLAQKQVSNFNIIKLQNLQKFTLRLKTAKVKMF